MSDRGETNGESIWSEPDLLKEVVQTSPVGITIVDGDGTVTFANERAEEIYGRPREEIDEVSHDDERWGLVDEDGVPLDTGEAPFDRILAEEEAIYDQILGLRRASGERVWVSVNGAPQWDADGDLDRAIFAFEDITERKERERELARALDLLEQTERTANVGGWEIDPDTQDVFWTDHLYDILQVDDDDEPSLEEALEVYHEGDRSIVEEAVEEALETGEPFDVEARFRTSSGEVRWLRVQGEAETVDEEVVSLRGAAQDVTERKQRERDLRDAKTQLEAATEAAAVGTWEWHVQEDEMVMDPSFAKRFGVDPEEAREGVSLDKYVSSIHEDDLERVEAMIDEALASCGEYEAEYRVWNDAGELRWVIARGRVECDADGTPVTFPGAVTDITERKEYQRKLEESNERLEQFAYAASHDLQEPLRMVSSYLQLIESQYADELDADGEEFIEYAVDGAERMKAMINGLLEYSRVETEGDPFEPVDFDAGLDDVLTDLHLQIEEHDADVTVDDLPDVQGDEDQLRQVFQNLLDNAIEYSGDEPPRVHVSAERTGSKWRISIHDEGIGIDPDEQDRIFRVFQRLHSREEHPGMGIGLALCRRIVERHGGKIWVDSEPEDGSTFTFTIPAADEHGREQS